MNISGEPSYLRWERNFPVEWPDPSQPGIGHLNTIALTNSTFNCPREIQENEPLYIHVCQFFKNVRI